MLQIFGVFSLATIAIGGYWHIQLIGQRRIKPPPAAFLSFALGMTVSYGLYWQDPEATIWGNPAQLRAAIQIVMIWAALWYTKIKDGKLKEELTEHWDQALVATFAVMLAAIAWALITFSTLDRVLIIRCSFVISQLLMIGGYVGTTLRFLRWRSNHESLFAWSFVLLSSLLGIYPSATALMGGDWLSIINIIRASVLSALTLGFLVGLDAANGRFVTQKEK